MPVVKTVGDEVIGGTININGSIEMIVTTIGEDTTLAQIIRLVESAQSSKAPIQAVADRIASKFVPFVLVFSITTFVVWAALLNSGIIDDVKNTWPYKEQGFTDWTLPLLFAISVLVIACPCALGEQQCRCYIYRCFYLFKQYFPFSSVNEYCLCPLTSLFSLLKALLRPLPSWLVPELLRD